MRKTARALLAICICLLAFIMLVACNETEDVNNTPKTHSCKDCGADKPRYCVNYNTDKEVYYCFSCYWENHSLEKPVTQITYDVWWE